MLFGCRNNVQSFYQFITLTYVLMDNFCPCFSIYCVYFSILLICLDLSIFLYTYFYSLSFLVICLFSIHLSIFYGSFVYFLWIFCLFSMDLLSIFYIYCLFSIYLSIFYISVYFLTICLFSKCRFILY